MTKIYRRVLHNPVKRMANTPRLLALGVFLTLTIAALAFMALEGTSVLDGFYWASTTITSVGYGDLSPATWGGKVMTIVFQLWSLFVLLPCAVANIIDSVRVDEHKMTHQEQEWLFGEVTKISLVHGIQPAPQPHDFEGE